MRELTIVPGQTHLSDIRTWLNECRDEISDAYLKNDLKTARILSKTYDAVKEFEEKVANESFRDYLKYHMLSESVTEEGGTVSLIEVDEMKSNFDKNLKNTTTTIDAVAKFDQEDKLIELNPIVMTIKFNLEFMEEPQYIVLTYTPLSLPSDLDIDSIPKKDYKATATDDGVTVTFKSISNLADAIGDIEFKESIEWPFEMNFKSATIEKKFNKNASLGAKIIALLGKEHLIDKVSGYKSIHSAGVNKQTRNAKEEEELRLSIRRTTGCSRTQILMDMLTAIPGITSVKEYDIPGNGKYYKRIRLTFNGGYFDVLNGGFDFVVKDNIDKFGNQREFFTDTEDPDASIERTRNLLVNYIIKRMKVIQNTDVSANKNGLLLHRLGIRNDFNAVEEYNKFIADAEGVLTGEKDIPITALKNRYDKLMDNERELSDAQMGKLMDYGNELNL